MRFEGIRTVLRDRDYYVFNKTRSKYFLVQNTVQIFRPFRSNCFIVFMFLMMAYD